MPSVRRNLCFLFFCFSLTVSSQSSAQFESGSFRQTTIKVGASDTSVSLPHQFIVKGSEIVHLDTQLLTHREDYVLDDRYGVITFLSGPISLLKKDTSRHTLSATYHVLPFQLKDRYQHRELVMQEDTAMGQRIQVPRPTTAFSVDELFGASVQKSGSIVRGFTVGSNRDLSLTSGFRMQMAGNIAGDVEVVAALTDENTPIQPEGNTQTLQEIDKVFVEIRSTDLSATLGDFNVEFTGNEFGGYRRKLQGAKGVAQYRTGFANGSAVVSGAINRGKFNTNQIQGIEGVQGPYRLNGLNNERDIIIIAGTEKIYVDGEAMTRGETNDYIIDYASGEVTFTSRRLITGVSRIVVDFEYTDRQYTRNLLGTKAGVNLLGDQVRMNITIIREADDQDAPIDVSLNEADKEILRNAGGDRLSASRPGADSVGAGNGQYSAVDTVIQGVPKRIYRFAPSDTSASYNVFFSFVGVNQGDYVKVSIGHFRFAGIGQGSYLPVRFLPLPQLQTLTDIDLDARLTDDLTISGEYALSTVDLNRFSALDDVDNRGPAVNVGVRFAPKDVTIGETNLGSFDLSFRERFIDRRFTPIDRTNDVEFARIWDLERLDKLDEHIREGRLQYKPLEHIAVGGGFGRIERGEQFSSNRYEFTAGLHDVRYPKANYAVEIIKSRDRSLNYRGDWVRQGGSVEYTTGVITPGFRYEHEDKRTRSLDADTLIAGSFRFHEFAPRLAIVDVGNMSLTSEFAWRLEDSSLSAPTSGQAPSLQRESETFTQQYSWRLREWNSLSSNIDLTLRKKKFTEPFQLRGNTDTETILMRFQSRYSPLSRGLETELFYQAASQRASKLERAFVRVPRGTGTYRYLGDVNGNGLIDDADFQLDRFDGDFVATTVPSDDLFPIVDVQASIRFRLTPSRFLTPDGTLGRLFSALSAETYFRVEEKSRESDTRQIYFLKFSRFLNETTTITGSNFISQDLHVLENSPEMSLRFRFTQRNGFTQFSLANERSYARERSVRVRWQLVKEIANQTDFVNKADRLVSSQPSIRTRDIASNSMVSDWSYRPEQHLEFGFTFGVGRGEDTDSLPSVTADFNNQGTRLVYSFLERGQARAEFHREEVVLNRSSTYLPFELTGGRLAGKTWLWNIAFEYRLTQFIQTSMSYDGRSEGGGVPVHTARMEVKAFF